MRLMPVARSTPWVPFAVAAFLFTVLLGALNGALNLWSLHLLQRGVPVEHHQSHALAQLFGFMWLLTAGISFHLAPRLLGAPLPSPTEVRWVAWLGIVGVLLLVAGRLGSLVPGTAALGVLGAVALVGAMGLWGGFVARSFWRRQVVGDWLPFFLFAGGAWWVVAAVCAFGWQLGQVVGGPLARVPLESVYAAASYGGTACWLLGIALRAGACTMRIERPSVQRQRLGFVVWQVSTGALFLQPMMAVPALVHGASLVAGAGVVTMVLLWRPFQRAAAPAFPREPRLRVALVAAWTFAVVAGALTVWRGLELVGAPQTPWLRDAARHAFTLGFAQVAVFAFAGRMLPSFEGVELPSRAVYDVGLVALCCGAALRIAASVLPSAPWVSRLSGVSGLAALVGVGLLSGMLLEAMRRGRRLRTPVDDSVGAGVHA